MRSLDASAARSVAPVDDEPDARDLLEAILGDVGAHTLTAASAREAYELITTRSFDLLVSDIGMPDEDGYSLIRRVRALSPGCGGAIAAIAVTAFAQAEDRMKALAAGFTPYVRKPVDASELIAVARGLAAIASSR